MVRKVALVTGAGSGIGRASAIEFARLGCDVVVVDVDEAAGQETCRLIEETQGHPSLGQEGPEAHPLWLHANVADEHDVKVMMEQVESRYGRLDYVHNNAGIEGERAPTHEYSTSMFDKLMSVNVRGVWLCLKYEIPLMLATGSEGAIVITSSTAGLRGMPGFGPYSASKHALVGLARSCALEYAGRLRVNCINPATTDTPMVERFAAKWPRWQAATNASYPIGRIATAQEVAEAAVWLCAKAGFVTGQTLVLDGGSTA